MATKGELDLNLLRLDEDVKERFKPAIKMRELWGTSKAQVTHLTLQAAHVEKGLTALCVLQPAGGEGVEGVYGTLTKWSLATIMAALMALGLGNGGLLCDIGAGLGG